MLSIQYSENFVIVQENRKLIDHYFSFDNKTEEKENYFGILEIPSIQLKRGFYSYESIHNSVDKNIEVISPNCMPNEICNFILASHSGSSSISFFKHLDNLKLNDEAIIYFQNERIKYKLIKKEEIYKNGNIPLVEPTCPMLILTTCHKKNDQLQELYYFTKKVS